MVASRVSTTTAIKAVEPQAASDEARVPNVMSGTKTVMVKGSTFDQRPISVMRRWNLVLATRCFFDLRFTDHISQAMPRILTAGMAILVQKMMMPSGQSPAPNNSSTPLKMV